MMLQLLRQRSRLLPPALLLTLAMALPSPAWAGPRAAAEPVLQANDLLRQAVANEMPDVTTDYFAWMDRVEKPRGSVTKLMVNTPQGILSRTIAINDQALTGDERRKDDERINRLLDPEQMREKAEKQQEDRQHVERLLRALPDAFRCTYSADVPKDRNLLLECSPNPAFSPPNFESQVLQGMKAEILIDREDKRITRITATLFKDVSFGWGILAKLSRGGHFEILQTKVAGNHWGVTNVELRFDGHLIVVKPLHMEESESAWSYRPVPGMSVAQALDFLRNSSATPTRPADASFSKQKAPLGIQQRGRLQAAEPGARIVRGTAAPPRSAPI